SSMGQPRPEYRIEVNRDLANELALDVGQISATVRPLLAGQVATTWEDPSGEERDVVVQLAAEQRASLDDLLTLPNATGRRTDAGAAVTVPLGQVARVVPGTAPAQIDRQNLQRVVTVGAATSPELSISEASAQIGRAIQTLDVPAGYSVTFGGETEQLQETV